MPDISRCLELIHQANGTEEEKYECALMGYYGNVPLFQYQPQVYPVYDDWEPPVYDTSVFQYDALTGGQKSMSKCCCGSGGSGGGNTGGGAAVSPSLAIAPAPTNRTLTSQAFSISANGSWLLLIILAILMLASRKGK